MKELTLTILEALIMEPSSDHWWIDSGTTCHVVKSKDNFFTFKEIPPKALWLFMGNNT